MVSKRTTAEENFLTEKAQKLSISVHLDLSGTISGETAFKIMWICRACQSQKSGMATSLLFQPEDLTGLANQLCRILGTEFFKQVFAMRFYRIEADSQLFTYDFCAVALGK